MLEIDQAYRWLGAVENFVCDSVAHFDGLQRRHSYDLYMLSSEFISLQI